MVEPFRTLGGEERVVWDLLRLLDRRLFEIEIACNYGGPFQNRLESLGLPLNYFRMRGKESWGAFFSLMRIIKRGDYDLIHCHGSFAGLFTRLAAFLCGRIPVIYTMHTIPNQHREWTQRRPWLGWGYVLVFHLLDQITAKVAAVSYAQLERRLKQRPVSPGKLQVIHAGRNIDENFNPEERNRFRDKYNIPADCFLIGIVSLLKPLKGIETFLTALKKLIERDDTIYGVIVGGGEKQADFINLAQRLSLRHRLIFTGEIEDAVKILPAFDAAVQPSLYEGLSITLLEYMAAGLPITASDIPSNREALTEGEEGLFFPAGDTEALTDAIAQLHREPELRKRLGEAAARRYKRDFTSDIMVEKYAGLYLELLGR
ncbi:glycosyltransferase [bacterium]|nr:glycosyltransferase [FCB group bacterium]MBL7191298.1 glycosyltransferase [bacterium]